MLASLVMIELLAHLMNLKETIEQVGKEMGFERVVIGSLAPLKQEGRHFQKWLDKGFAASMSYLERDPNSRTSPQTIYPHARSVIILSVSYYSTPPPDPGPRFGRVAAYAVGLDYHVVIKAKLRELTRRLKELTGAEIQAKTCTDDVALYEQGLAARHGLGFSGKNRLIIAPKLAGSYNFVAELFTDLQLEPDEPYQGTCGNCFRCGQACPTAAINEGEGVDSRLCISFLTIENKGQIPLALRPKLGRWLFGCDVCQIVCPYNQRPPESQWSEFSPSSGVGHYVDLLDLLLIPDQEKFHQRFIASAVRRPKRRGFLRNALVVLGNSLSDDATTYEDRQQILSAVRSFANAESDELLLEHAAWALSRDKAGRADVAAIASRIENKAMQEQIAAYAR